MEIQVKNQEEEQENAEQYFSRKDLAFQIVSIVLTYGLLRLIINGFGGLWVTVGTVSFCVAVLVYAKVKKLHFKWYDYTYLAYVLALGFSFSLQDNRVLLHTNMIFLLLSFYYWVITLSGSRETNCLDHNVGKDLLFGLLLYPFKNLSQVSQMYKATEKGKSNALYISLGIVISLPIFVMVVALLGSANEAFYQLLRNISHSVKVFQSLFYLFLAIPLGYYFFLIVYRNMNLATEEEEGYEFEEEEAKVKTRKPDSLFLTILVIFIPIYLLFFITAAIGYVDAKEVAATINISHFARQGFFQLVVVSVINVGIFGFIRLLSSNSRGIKIGLTLIGLETIGLIIMAFIKMQMYISTYGLTILRFNTTWFMIVLFVCVGIFITRLWKSFNYIKGVTTFIALSVLILSFRNVGNDIAAYNYQRFNQKNLAEFDISVLYSIGVEAVPTAAAVYEETNDERLKEELENYLTSMEYEINTVSKNVKNIQRNKAVNEIVQVLN